MILRRFVEHVKAQNWFAVGLDMLVVVAGIYIGMTLSNWNEAEKGRAEGREYLERILSDLDQSQVLQQREVEISKFVADSVQTVVTSLAKEELTEEEKEKLTESLAGMRFFRTMRLNMGAVREMQSSGKMGLIEDLEVRQAIAELDEFYARELRTMDTIQVYTSPVLQEIQARLPIVPGEDGQPNNVVYDLDELRADKVFQKKIQSLIMMTSQKAFADERLMNETRAVADLIRRKTGLDALQPEETAEISVPEGS